MKKIVYLLTSALLLSLSSCKKKEDKERPEFDYQPQHFSCYVNGEEFIPKGAGTCRGTSTFYDPDGFLNTNAGYLYIIATNCSQKTKDLGFTINPVLEVGIYNLPDTTMKISIGYYNEYFAGGKYFLAFDGYVNITKLEPQTYRPFVQGRIEGTFEMSCANDQGDTVHITDGSFSLNLR